MSTHDTLPVVQFIPFEWFAQATGNCRLYSYPVSIERRAYERRQIQIGLDEACRRKAQRRQPSALAHLMFQHMGEFFSPALRNAYLSKVTA